MAISFDGHLQALHMVLSPGDALSAVDTLIKITRNVIDNPGNEQYRQLRTTNKTFNQRVWRHSDAREFMALMGWIQVDDVVILPSESSDDLLHSALAELIRYQSMQPSSEQTEAVLPTVANGTSDDKKTNSEHQQRIKEMKQRQKQIQEEKKRIADQIKADRRETDKRESKPSHARELKFGKNLNRFEDIGVDLNKGGG